MMAKTRLTNDVRESTIRAALRAAFNPRIDALKKKFTAYAVAYIAKEHPKFVKLKADKDNRQYMGIQQDCNLICIDIDTTGHIGIREPSAIGEWVGNRVRDYGSSSPDGYRKIKANTECPVRMDSISIDMRDPLIVEHFALWDDYFSAMKTLREALYGYTVREIFEADFPELVRYMPARVAPTMALVVPVADLRLKLAGVGIPASA
jgi:hypothetical protein